MFVIKNQLTSQSVEFRHLNPPSPVHGSLNVISIAILFPFVYVCSLAMAAVGGIVSTRMVLLKLIVTSKSGLNGRRKESEQASFLFKFPVA